MKVEWDYTNLADAYLRRPDYAQEVIDRMDSIADIKKGDKACDVGAGVAHLTIMLAAKDYDVTAVEPNDAMRTNGIKRTENFNNVKWFEGGGEHTGQEANCFKLVTFGSSFNVCNRQEALEEAQRILVKDGWFACMWNHRNLDDPIQQSIEGIIKKYIPNYDYGTRREDQTEVIEESGRFDNIQAFSGKVIHSVKVEDVVEAWRSHGTLERQAKDKFKNVVDDIEDYINVLDVKEIKVLYVTRIWMARVKKSGGVLKPVKQSIFKPSIVLFNAYYYSVKEVA